MTHINISVATAARLKLRAERWVIQTLSDRLTFEVPGARHMPLFKNKMWDGKICLIDQRTNTVAAGLLPRILAECRHRSWAVDIGDGVWLPNETVIGDEEFNRFLDDIQLPSKFREALQDKYAYQVDAVKKCIQFGRRLVLSPTGTGKSMIMYLAIRYHLWSRKIERALVVSVTTNLVRQLASDFVDYGCDPDLIHTIFEGQDKSTDRPIVITTWQSMLRQNPVWARRFDMLLADEAHTYKSKVTGQLMESTTNAKVRLGFTGTLDGTETHLWVLEGTFGPVYRTTTTKKAIEAEVLAPLSVHINTLTYPESDLTAYARRPKSQRTYDHEKNFIAGHAGRRRAICQYAHDLPATDNVLMLFKSKTKAAAMYFDVLQDMADGKRDIYYVTGDMDAEDREVVRQQLEQMQGAVVVATYKVFATGINVKRLHHLIPVEGIKSVITLLQSIGRILRRDGSHAHVHDMVDDLRCGVDRRPNFAYAHAIERLNIYDAQGFPYDHRHLAINPSEEKA